MISKGILRLTLFSLSLAGITMQLHAQAPATTFEELRDWASALWQAPVLRRSRSAQHAKTMASVQRSLRFSFFPTFTAAGAGLGALFDSFTHKHETVYANSAASASRVLRIAPIVGKKTAGVNVSFKF